MVQPIDETDSPTTTIWGARWGATRKGGVFRVQGKEFDLVVLPCVVRKGLLGVVFLHGEAITQFLVPRDVIGSGFSWGLPSSTGVVPTRSA